MQLSHVGLKLRLKFDLRHQPSVHHRWSSNQPDIWSWSWSPPIKLQSQSASAALASFFAQRTVQWPTLVLLRYTILHIQKCREVDTLRRWGLIRIGLRSPSVVIEAISLNNKRTLSTLQCVGTTHYHDIVDVIMCSTIRDSRYSHHNDYCCCGSH